MLTVMVGVDVDAGDDENVGNSTDEICETVDDMTCERVTLAVCVDTCVNTSENDADAVAVTACDNVNVAACVGDTPTESDRDGV